MTLDEFIQAIHDKTDEEILELGTTKREIFVVIRDPSHYGMVLSVTSVTYRDGYLYIEA